jgi:hypothetical protein
MSGPTSSARPNLPKADFAMIELLRPRAPAMIARSWAPVHAPIGCRIAVATENGRTVLQGRAPAGPLHRMVRLPHPHPPGKWQLLVRFEEDHMAAQGPIALFAIDGQGSLPSIPTLNAQTAASPAADGYAGRPSSCRSSLQPNDPKTWDRVTITDRKESKSKFCVFPRSSHLRIHGCQPASACGDSP